MAQTRRYNPVTGMYEDEAPIGAAFTTNTSAPLTGQQASPTPALPQLSRVAQIAVPNVPDTSGLRFNETYAPQANTLNAQAANADFAYQQANRALEQGYQRDTQESQRLQQVAQQKLMEKLSGQGLALSGVVGSESGDLAGEYSRYNDALNYNLTGNKNNILAQKQGTLADIAGAKAGIYALQGRDEAQQNLQREQTAAQARATQQAAQQQAQALIQAANIQAQAARAYNGVQTGGGGVSYSGGVKDIGVGTATQNQDSSHLYALPDGGYIDAPTLGRLIDVTTNIGWLASIYQSPQSNIPQQAREQIFRRIGYRALAPQGFFDTSKVPSKVPWGAHYF